MQRARDRRLCRWLLGPVSLALLSPGAQAAAFLPGAEADPATGALTLAPASAAEPLRGNGIQWALAPWRIGGTLTLDLRALRQEDGSSSGNGLLISDIDFASHVWQPWFVQLRLGLGLLASRSDGAGPGLDGGGSTALTARAAVTVFPASRFPFELRADISDSRASGVALGSDYRSRRFGLSQAYRPPEGNDSYQLQVDHSQLDDGRTRDTLSTVNGTALHRLGLHTIDVGVNHADNRRSSDGEHTTLSALNLRHAFQPDNALTVENLASWNELRLQGGASEFGNDVRQLSSFMTWRVPAGTLFPVGTAPLVAASARWVQSRALGREAGARVQAVNATAGINLEPAPAWRLSLSATASELRAAGLSGGHSLGVQGSVGWAPRGALWAGWRYVPSVSVNAGHTDDSQRGGRDLLGAQASHAVTRELPVSDNTRLSLALTQSGAVLHETGADGLARALAHSASLSWQSLSNDGSQSYGGVSLSESRTAGSSSGSFQLANLQWTQRTQLSRQASWSASLTAQATRNRASEVDVFSGQRRERSGVWLHYTQGTLSYENQRAFGVPRLRHSVLLGVSSHQLESRALGDIDAQRERISESLETRLDYAIGRLDTRLSARAARVDGRWVAALQARAQRRF